jgi:hypothetical protein
MLNTWKPRLVCAALVGAVAVAGCFDFTGAHDDCVSDERCKPVKPCEGAGSPDQPDDGFLDTNCDGIDGNAATALFVDPASGNDANAGTPDSPVRTIKRALALLRTGAGAGITALYLAQGSYDEDQLTLDRPVSLYGAYGGSANNWKRKSEYTTFLDGGTVGLTVSGLGPDAGVRMEWLTISSANATAPGTASIALHIRDTHGLQLNHTTLTAGLGANGERGSDGLPGLHGADGGVGENAIGATGGRGGTSGVHPIRSTRPHRYPTTAMG